MNTEEEIREYLEKCYKGINPKHKVSQSEVKAFKLGQRELIEELDKLSEFESFTSPVGKLDLWDWIEQKKELLK